MFIAEFLTLLARGIFWEAPLCQKQFFLEALYVGFTGCDWYFD